MFNRSIPTYTVETAEGSYRHKLRRTDRKERSKKETKQRTVELSDTDSGYDVIEIPE